MSLQDGYVDEHPYWGYFENKTVAQRVINDLCIALGISNKKKSLAGGKYVIAFRMNNKLYIASKGYYGLVITPKGAWHAKGSLDSIPFPSSGILILSKDYMDDLPSYSNAEEFCAMSGWYCIPLRD